MTDELLSAFDEGLNRLAAGEPVSAILARHPRLAGDLRPMLEAAQAAHRLGADAWVPAAAQNRSRAQFLTHAAALRGRPPARGFLGLAAVKAWALANRAAAVTLAFVLGFVLGTYGVVSASAESLPGEPLYTVKRVYERTQLWLSLDTHAREALESDFNDRRVQEVERLLAGARRAEVQFGGLLDSRDGERWMVAGIRVIVPGSAEVIGTSFPGLYVAVEGFSQSDGTVIATRVEVTGLTLVGTVLSQSATSWQVNGTVLEVNAATLFVGEPRLGDRVSVIARGQPGGSWLALRIAREPDQPVATPAATATPPPAATSTPPPATAAPQPVEVEFSGVVEAIGGSSWQIAGVTVLVNGGTEIRDNPQVGQRVKVRAWQDASGSLTALRIEPDHSGEPQATAPVAPPATATNDDDDGGGGPGPSPSNTPRPGDDDDDDEHDEEQEWEGTLESVNGSTWVIAGRAVTVTGETEIEHNPQVGDRVRVKAKLRNQVWVAEKIEKR
jgi:hypothetical protein